MSSTACLRLTDGMRGTRFAAGQPAATGPSSSSLQAQVEKRRAAPASWRRSRQPMTWALGWNVYHRPGWPAAVRCRPRPGTRNRLNVRRKRWFMPTMTLAVFLARLDTRSTPATVRASGRSHRTCSPRRAPSDVDPCRWLGVQIATASAWAVLQDSSMSSERLLDVEPTARALRLAQIVVAIAALDAGQRRSDGRWCDLRDRSRPDDGDADRVAHFPASGTSRPTGSDTVDSRREYAAPSSVKRHRFAPIRRRACPSARP